MSIMTHHPHSQYEFPENIAHKLGFEQGEAKRIILGFKEHDGVIGVLIEDEGINGDLGILSQLLQFTLDSLDEAGI